MLRIANRLDSLPTLHCGFQVPKDIMLGNGLLCCAGYMAIRFVKHSLIIKHRTKYANMYPNDRSSIHRTLSYSNAVEYTNIWAAYIECRTMDIIL